MDIKDILRALPSLGPEALENVRKRCVALQSISGAPATKADLEVERDWLLQGILAELRGRGLGRTIPSGFRIKSMKTFQGYPQRAERVRDWIEGALPTMTPGEKKKMGWLLAAALAAYLEPWAGVSLQSMLINVAKAPEALEKSYPGYIQAGLLGFILGRKTK